MSQGRAEIYARLAPPRARAAEGPPGPAAPRPGGLAPPAQDGSGPQRSERRIYKGMRVGDTRRNPANGLALRIVCFLEEPGWPPGAALCETEAGESRTVEIGRLADRYEPAEGEGRALAPFSEAEDRRWNELFGAGRGELAAAGIPAPREADGAAPMSYTRMYPVMGQYRCALVLVYRVPGRKRSEALTMRRPLRGGPWLEGPRVRTADAGVEWARRYCRGEAA